MKKSLLLVMYLISLFIFTGCENDPPTDVKEYISKGVFAFSEIKGSYQLYNINGNLDNIYGDAIFIEDGGNSYEVELIGSVDSNGYFVITETEDYRAASAVNTNISLNGSMTSGTVNINSIQDENNQSAVFSYINDPNAILTINIPGEEAFLSDNSGLYPGPGDGYTSSDADTNALWKKNWTNVTIVNAATGNVESISVYDDGSSVSYWKQVGSYDSSNKKITFTSTKGYDDPSCSPDSLFNNFQLYEDIIATINDDGTVVYETFWTGRSWNKGIGKVTY